jgi:5-methyltetrahydropteroyltriglutamate--homocysteine methyltransferase
VTFLKLGKKKDNHFSVFDLLEPLLEVYVSVLHQLKSLGAETVQLDEPVLVTDLGESEKAAFRKSYETFAKRVSGIEIILTAYFGGFRDNLPLAASLPVHGLHIDLVRAPEELGKVLESVPAEKTLSLGVVNGRNIWKSDFEKIIRLVEPAFRRKERKKFVLAPSCSLLHVPLDLEGEKEMDLELKSWLSFAKQKLTELAVVKRALAEGEKSVGRELEENRRVIQSRRESPRIHKEAVQERLRRIRPEDYSRKSPYKVRRQIQRAKLSLPLFPTTTIGSFPQTLEVRQARAKYKKGDMTSEQYLRFLKDRVQDVIKRQTEMGLDVLVHGEFERTDMVEYFGELLEGFAFTENGWVQSYGSRYVKPPVIFGDVLRPKPMTVDWITYAQSLTDKPVKGMLTGPITILQWSFVRDDQPRSETARQIAFAIREEVCDLEKAGIRIIQIDEPALREGLPLRRSDWREYLQWAVECFKLASSGVRDETQVHTHMCYSEFNDIIESIAELDADVISIETSRSQMELLDAFSKFRYPNEIGPGVYDIHSPRVPSVHEIENLLSKASDVLPVENIWVNPDCGLKTRGWDETTLSLKAMVQAAKSMRKLSLSRPS